MLFVLGWIRIEVAGMLLCISFALCLDVSRVCHDRPDRDPLVLLQAREVNVVSKGLGPRAALTHANLAARTGPEKVTWLEESRIDAIIGSCSLSLKSVRSGVRCYMAFAGKHVFLHVALGLLCMYCFPADVKNVGSRMLPPALDMLLSWSTLFRSEGTFSNYMGHLRTACLLCRVSTKVLHVSFQPLCMYSLSHHTVQRYLTTRL